MQSTFGRVFSLEYSIFSIRVIGYSVFGIQFSVFNRVVVFDPLRNAVVVVAAVVVAAAAVVVFPFCCSFITKFV